MSIVKTLPKNHCFSCINFKGTKCTICCSDKCGDKFLTSDDDSDIRVLAEIANGKFNYPNFHNRYLKCKNYKTNYVKIFFSNIVGEYFKICPMEFPTVLVKLLGGLCIFVVGMLCSVCMGLYIWKTQGSLFYLFCNMMLLFSIPFLTKNIIKECKRITCFMLNESKWLSHEIQRRNELLNVQNNSYTFTEKFSTYDEFSTPEKLEIAKDKLRNKYGIDVRKDNPNLEFLFDEKVF